MSFNAAIFFALALAVSSPLHSRSAEAADSSPSDNWSMHWAGCYDIDLKYHRANRQALKDLISSGKGWESSVEQEIKEIDRVTEVTCKKWAENPNGNEPLAEFTKEFAAVSLSALSIKQKVNQFFTPQLKEWNNRSAIELAVYGYKFQEFPCGQAFARTEKHITQQVQAIEMRFDNLRKKCPKAADAIIAETLKRGDFSPKFGKGDGGPANAKTIGKGQRQPASESSITGTQKALDEEARSKSILQDQK